MKLIQNQTFDAERALYGEKDIRVIHCAFDGPADGESAFKEGSDIEVQDCFFTTAFRKAKDNTPHDLTHRERPGAGFCAPGRSL